MNSRAKSLFFTVAVGILLAFAYRYFAMTQFVWLNGRPYHLDPKVAKANKRMARYLKRQGIRDFHVMYMRDWDSVRDEWIWCIHIFDPSVETLEWARGIPIKQLEISGTKIHDISPLKPCARHLDVLHAVHTPISDISALSNCIRLTSLQLEDTLVSDLAPLSNVDIGRLAIRGTPVRDISFIRTNLLDEIKFSLTPTELIGIDKFKHKISAGICHPLSAEWRIYDNFYSGTATNADDMEEYNRWERHNRQGTVPHNYFHGLY